jgi:hypothetical protein|eukprot:COSAG06_NODE_2117_length_7557_cov_47.910432_5_plen_46_part_00
MSERSRLGVEVDDGMWSEVLAAGELFGVSSEELESIVTSTVAAVA